MKAAQIDMLAGKFGLCDRWGA